METVIQRGEGFECPSCDEPFTEEDMQDVCNEPFNGSVLECGDEECGKEWSVDILFEVKEA